MGKPMVMGRKTFDAIGRPLDGRDTIVVTRNTEFRVDGVHVVDNVGKAMALAAQLAEARGTDDIVIAGGGEIYVAAMPYATRVYLDVIEADIVGDTVFPGLDPVDWREVSRLPIEPSPKDDFAATAVTYERRGVARSPS